MPNPYIDPMDMAPVIGRRSFKQPQINPTPAPAEPSVQFKQLLDKKVKEEPTPILTSAALNVPDLPITNQAVAPSQIQSNREDSQQIPAEETSDSSQALNPTSAIESDAAKGAPVTASAANLREIMAALTQNDVETVKQQPSLPTVDVTPEPSPILSTYMVKRGDTLSEIVADAMRKQNLDFNTADIYRMVRNVAQANGIRNPDRIIEGQLIDLSPITTGSLSPLPANRMVTGLTGDYRIPVTGRITSPYGMRLHPISGEDQFHNGVDIAVPIGTSILPIKPGIVTYAGELRGYGQMVEVDHGDNTISRYGHLAALLVSAGDKLQPNAPVGLSGDTGLSTGPHLHLEIIRNGRTIDPLTILPQNLIETPVEIARRNDGKEPV
ncbi:MAG: hypothetical protein C4527_12755 [Candidatus Omnitrophota bacterium]|jgi:murein DD-endopeptidase MepM/ murein hydrolase activator NlpD|nr:MAG: hypothetical protein C4527_12755 [Candidatus Omnitrophota bacterium]